MISLNPPPQPFRAERPFFRILTVYHSLARTTVDTMRPLLSRKKLAVHGRVKYLIPSLRSVRRKAVGVFLTVFV